MFFITPGHTEANGSPPNASDSIEGDHSNKRKRLSQEHDPKYGQLQLQDQDGCQLQERDDFLNYNRKRIARACDRCRLKKTKCSGGTVCNRCKHDRVVCVTTPAATRKGDIQQHPGYVHLVETQRDQLARALHQLLRTRDPVDSDNVKSLLISMGITTDSIRTSEQSHLNTNNDHNDHNIEIREPINAETDLVTSPSLSQFCDDMFNDFSGPQLEAIEAFCATNLPLQSLPNDAVPADSFDNRETEFDYAFESGSHHEAFTNSLEIDVNSTETASDHFADSHHTAVDPRSLVRIGQTLPTELDIVEKF